MNCIAAYARNPRKIGRRMCQHAMKNIFPKSSQALSQTLVIVGMALICIVNYPPVMETLKLGWKRKGRKIS